MATACAGRQPEAVNPNVYPANFKTAVLEFLRTNGNAFGIRNAFIAPPVLQPLGTETRYVVCVRYEAPDPDGHYSGSRDHAAIFFSETLNQFIDATPQQCGSAAYQPFSELQSTKPGK